MIDQINTYKESIKKKFEKYLDDVFDKLNESVNISSVHSNFDFLLEQFYDNKNNFEEDDGNIHSELALLKTIQNIFGFRKIAKKFKFDDHESIRDRLKHIESYFGNFLVDLGVKTHVYKQHELQPLLDNKKSRREDFLFSLDWKISVDHKEIFSIDNYKTNLNFIPEMLKKFKKFVVTEQSISEKNKQFFSKQFKNDFYIFKKIQSSFITRTCYLTNSASECIIENFQMGKSKFYLRSVNELFEQNQRWVELDKMKHFVFG